MQKIVLPVKTASNLAPFQFSGDKTVVGVIDDHVVIISDSNEFIKEFIKNYGQTLATPKLTIEFNDVIQQLKQCKGGEHNESYNKLSLKLGIHPSYEDVACFQLAIDHVEAEDCEINEIVDHNEISIAAAPVKEVETVNAPIAEKNSELNTTSENGGDIDVKKSEEPAALESKSENSDLQPNVSELNTTSENGGEKTDSGDADVKKSNEPATE